jgi:hypothetical protein
MAGLVPGIHVLLYLIANLLDCQGKTWMAGTSPAMTMWYVPKALVQARLV